MNEKQLRTVVGNLRRVIGSDTADRVSDGQLLERFLTRRDEIAFEMLVWRHGSMVLNVCRRVLRDAHEAEDAFQATFLVFARKLASIGKGESIGGWLYKVAYRVALRSRGRLAARQMVALQDWEHLPGNVAFDDPAQRAVWSDLRPVLDEEVNRLPEKYRTAFVLIYLEGMPYPDVAKELRCPKGTVSSRVTAAKGILRKRLARRGVVLSATLLGAVLTRAADAAVPVGLTISTLQAVRLLLDRSAGCAAGSVRAVALAQGVLRAMTIAKMKLVAALVIAAGVAGFGTSVAVQQAVQAQGPTTGEKPVLKPPVEGGTTANPRTGGISLMPPAGEGVKPLLATPAALAEEYLNFQKVATTQLQPPGSSSDGDLATRLAKIEARLARLEQGTNEHMLMDVLKDISDQQAEKDFKATGAYTVNAPKINIPIKVANKSRDNIQELNLYVSEDKGVTWKRAVTIGATMNAFPFNAPSDGVYWFKLQVVHKDGSAEPQGIDFKTPPDLKLNFLINRPKDDKEHFLLRQGVEIGKQQKNKEAMLRDLEVQLKAIQNKIAELKGDQEEKPPGR
jgi:RNA polymerase sigma factor (sigma-70 family)